jgi:hypothetical protein
MPIFHAMRTTKARYDLSQQKVDELKREHGLKVYRGDLLEERNLQKALASFAQYRQKGK